MGQYYKIANLDKKQFIDPYAFGDGAKLLEFGTSGTGVMAGLAILLANSNGRGGGDLPSDRGVVGSWAGDRIVIAGDYAQAGDAGEFGPHNIYTLCYVGFHGTGTYQDISDLVIAALCDDHYIKTDLFASAASSPSLRDTLEKAGQPIEASLKVSQ